jgi:hypothetical protein
MVMALQFRNFDYADLAMKFGTDWLTVLEQIMSPQMHGPL